MIKAVLFDFGGVLSPGGKSGCTQQLFASIYGISPEEINKDYELILAARDGKLDEQGYLDAMNSRHPGRPPATHDNYLANSDIFERSEPVYELAEALRKHGIATGILSNMNDFTAIELRNRGYYEGFDPVILSFEERCYKPDKRFYQIAVDRLGLKPNEIVLIDDQDKCGPPAVELGMRFILAVSPEQIVKDTEELILRENKLNMKDKS